MDNVCFENLGHAVFVEDAIEAKNVITGNLVIGTRPCFSCLNSDMTPASYWLVMGDNYVERNIAAGSTHEGFWFFPEAHVRGQSHWLPGSLNVCPPNTPILRFADNEAHNNMRMGFRVSSQGSTYAPRRNPCLPISEDNPFQTSQLLRLYAWRNGWSGILVGNVAAFHVIDAVVADNCWRGIEYPGTTGIAIVEGGWGSVALIRPIFVGHDLPCPACDRSHEAIYYGTDGDGKKGGFGPPGWGGGWDAFSREMRLGLATPAVSGLYVSGAKFINYDRLSMVAVTGAIRNCQPCAYGIIKANGAETRFRDTTWIQSWNRVNWRWQNEALFTDLDGTFGDQPFCKGCSVLFNRLVTDAKAMPECYPDARYGQEVSIKHPITLEWIMVPSGFVCKPELNFASVSNHCELLAPPFAHRYP